MSYGRILSEFIQRTSFEDLPEQVRKRVPIHLLDLLGVIYSGSQTEPARKVERMMAQSKGKQESTVIPAGWKTSCWDAALVNGTFANGVSLNDLHGLAGAHLGPVVIPAALAVGERAGSSGRDIVTAIVLGYEVMARVGKAISPSNRERGFHPTATSGVFGAAAAAAKLLGLGVEETVWAMGNAGTQSSGLFAFMDDGAMTITIHPGFAARNGVFAALLAREGFTGAEYIFESPAGFLGAMSDTPHPEKLCERLGESYEILNTGFKPYACCRLVHSSIDAILGIVKEEGALRPERIRGVTVRTSPGASKNTDPAPQTVVGARLSLPFNIALLLSSGNPPKESIPEKLLGNEELKRLSKKIEIVPDGAFSRYSSEVSITTEEGRVFSKKVEAPKGDPSNPLTAEDVTDKFKSLVREAGMSEARAESIIAGVARLEGVKTISSFMQGLVGISN